MVTQEMIDAQNKRLHDGLEAVAGGIAALKAENAKLRNLVEEIDAEIDRQLYGDAYVKECRDADLDIPEDAEHCVTITQALRRKIARAAGNS